MNDRKQYIFYRNNQESVRLTKESITYDIDKKVKTINLNNVISIKLRLISSLYIGYWKLIEIKTKSDFFKQSLYLNEIEDIESLFYTFNNLYSTKIQIPLDYVKYKKFTKEESIFYKLALYSGIITISLFTVPLFLAIIYAGLRTQSFGYQFTSYDKNNTIQIVESSNLLCPKKFELIKHIKNKYVYRYECIIGRKKFLLYEKELPKQEAISYNFKKNDISTKDIWYYLIKDKVTKQSSSE